MTTIATTSAVNTSGCVQSHWHGSAGVQGRMDGPTIEMRDKTVFWLDTDRQFNFLNSARTTAYRYIPQTFIDFATNYGAAREALLKDMQDNLLLCFFGYGVYPHLTINYWKYAKPAEGWAAWADNPSRGALSVTQWSFGWYNAQADQSYRGLSNWSGWHVARAANISSGVLYVSGAPTCNPNNGYTNQPYQAGFTVNLDNGNLITAGTNQSGYYEMYVPFNVSYLEGNTGYGRTATAQPFAPNSSEGVIMTWYMGNSSNLVSDQNGAYNNRSNNIYYNSFSRWVIDANGNLTASGFSGQGGTWFGTTKNVDFEATSGSVSIHARTTTYGATSYNSGNNSSLWWDSSGTKTIIICTIFNGKPVLNTPRGKWDVGNNTWVPENWTYNTTPTNWVFTPSSAPTITWLSPTVLRMIASNGTNGAYMDITWDGTNFTFPATATALPGLDTSSKVIAPGATILDKYTAMFRSSEIEVLGTGLNATSYTYPNATGSFPEPYVPTLKANNGIKFQYVSNAIGNNANLGHWQTDNNYAPPPWTTFQFKRVSSGGTEYYNYTTSAWTSSVVNNAAALFPSGGGACPPYGSTSQYTNDIQGTWADNTTYTYSYVFTDPNSITGTSNTKVLATPAVSAAPASPTPRRIFVYTLQNRTSSHVLSVENRVLINKVNLVNQSANSVGVTLNLGGYNFLSTITLAPYQTAQFETAVIANVAERLLVTCTADASVDMWIMGTEGV